MLSSSVEGSLGSPEGPAEGDKLCIIDADMLGFSDGSIDGTQLETIDGDKFDSKDGTILGCEDLISSSVDGSCVLGLWLVGSAVGSVEGAPENNPERDKLFIKYADILGFSLDGFADGSADGSYFKLIEFKKRIALW